MWETKIATSGPSSDAIRVHYHLLRFRVPSYTYTDSSVPTGHPHLVYFY